MSNLSFGITAITLTVGTIIFNKNRILDKIGNRPLYFCWALMLISDLGYTKSVQVIARAIALIICWYFLLVKTRGRIRLEKTTSGIVLTAYSVCCIISSIYSVAPFQTLSKALEIFTDVLIIWKIYTLEKKKDAFTIRMMDTTCIVLFYLVVVSLAGFIFDPNYFADTGYAASQTMLGIRFGNGILGANAVGAYSLLCILWAVLLKKNNKILSIIVTAISGIAMLISQSRGSWILIPLIIFFRLFKPKEHLKIVYLFAITIIGCFLLSHISLIYSYLLRGQDSVDIATLSGRTMMWRQAFEFIKKRPLFGYGFGVGGGMVGKTLTGGFYGIKHMHNGFIETLLGTGVIGCLFITLPFVYLLITVFLNTFKIGFRNNIADIILMIYFLIRSFTSLGVGGWHSPELMIWYLLLFAITYGRSIQYSYNRETK